MLTPSHTTNVGRCRDEAGRGEPVGQRLRAEVDLDACDRGVAEQVGAGGDDRRLAPRERGEVDLVHRPRAELGGEPVRAGVVARAEDQHLLDTGHRVEQVRVDERVPAQPGRGQAGELEPFGPPHQWAGRRSGASSARLAADRNTGA